MSEVNRECEGRRLRREFDQLPKTSHGEQALARHSDMRAEWTMRIIEDPYDQWNEFAGRTMTILAGRVPEFNQWIKVVFEGSSVATGEFVTVYADRQLADKYGGRPWGNQ